LEGYPTAGCKKKTVTLTHGRDAIHRIWPNSTGTLVLTGGLQSFKPNYATRYVREALHIAYPMLGVYPQLIIVLFQAAAINAYLNFGVSRAKVACSKA
jgi:hypothetical protein